MKTLFFTISLLILSLTVFSQEIRKGHIGIAIGPSIPVGDYADMNIDNSGAGFARTGINLNLHYTYKFNSVFGLTALCLGNFHSVDDEEMENELTRIDWTSAHWDVISGSWVSSALLIGPVVSLPYKSFRFEFKALAGASLAHMPYEYTLIDYGRGVFPTVFNVRSASNAVSFATTYCFGIGYELNDRLDMNCEGGFFVSRQEFDVAFSSNLGVINPYSTIEQQMNMVNISFGIGYKIN